MGFTLQVHQLIITTNENCTLNIEMKITHYIYIEIEIIHYILKITIIIYITWSNTMAILHTHSDHHKQLGIENNATGHIDELLGSVLYP